MNVDPNTPVPPSSNDDSATYDVALIGGGPAGSTAGCLLRKYDPSLKVAIFEKEKFPREHVGESQLPACSFYLNEMGCWDEVERADFPIKIGATYLWGNCEKPWDFEFIPLSQFPEDQARPAMYEGARLRTSFQVDRAIYDDILLRNAEQNGCEVHEETPVKQVHRDGDRVTGLTLGDGRRISARYYLDGSGHGGVLRRALEIPVEIPTGLKNMAVWDYWDNAEWAAKIGVGGTRVQVLSLPYGWIWFIPLGPTRTSIGFVCPVDYYKRSGLSHEELYAEAVKTQPRCRALTANATRENVVRSTTDWSFVSERLVGENWFLMGDAAGFADPVLAGGLTLTHESARHAAYTILELDRGEHDPEWLRHIYHELNAQRVMQFIRFADFWYASNCQFDKIQDITTEIAEDAGMTLSPQAAFRWLSLGGFNVADGGRPGIGGLDLGAVREVTSIFTTNAKLKWQINKFNVLRLDLSGAEEDKMPVFDDGRITARPCYRRGKKTLPVAGVFGHVFDVLEQNSDVMDIVQKLATRAKMFRQFHIHDAISTLETMILDGWIKGKANKKRPFFVYDPDSQYGESNIHENRDLIPGLEEGF